MKWIEVAIPHLREHHAFDCYATIITVAYITVNILHAGSARNWLSFDAVP